jgi:hypothetical protein
MAIISKRSNERGCQRTGVDKAQEVDDVDIEFPCPIKQIPLDRVGFNRRQRARNSSPYYTTLFIKIALSATTQLRPRSFSVHAGVSTQWSRLLGDLILSRFQLQMTYVSPRIICPIKNCIKSGHKFLLTKSHEGFSNLSKFSGIHIDFG